FADPQLRLLTSLPDTQIDPAGLMIATPEFRGATADRPDAEFELFDYEGPKLRAEMPGIQADALPH
ncbi:MAG: hypothetical protein KDA85_09035, partial [Planctomycetaceae bacterium]|nr:hypothetical protein [Planctomycetaceae bacterium]